MSEESVACFRRWRISEKPGESEDSEEEGDAEA
jgi:hypothetical protein